MAKQNVDTEKQVEAWKEKYRDVFQVEWIDDKGGEKTAYLRPPTRQILSLALTKGRKDTMAMVEVILKNCRLGGDEYPAEEPENLQFLVGMADQVEQIINAKTIQVKKL